MIAMIPFLPNLVSGVWEEVRWCVWDRQGTLMVISCRNPRVQSTIHVT
jgi:hypothetical protein